MRWQRLNPRPLQMPRPMLTLGMPTLDMVLDTTDTDHTMAVTIGHMDTVTGEEKKREAEAEPTAAADADADPWYSYYGYGLGHYGYRPYYRSYYRPYGYGYWGRKKREAEAEPTAAADAG